MSTTFPMYAEAARLEVDQRLRAAAAQRRRQLVRDRANAPRHPSYPLLRSRGTRR
jgi:hypothetical protein